MIRLDVAKSGAIRTSTWTLFLGLAVAGCSDPGGSSPSPKPDSVGGTSTATPPDAGKAPLVSGKKTAKVKPGSQIPGETNYSDKPGDRSRGR